MGIHPSSKGQYDPLIDMWPNGMDETYELVFTNWKIASPSLSGLYFTHQFSSVQLSLLPRGSPGRAEAEDGDGERQLFPGASAAAQAGN